MASITKEEVFAHRKSDTVVVYGSGASLLEIENWDELRQYDSFGFNWFVFQKWIKPTYMLVGDLRPDKVHGELLGRDFDEVYEKYLAAIDGRYDGTVFFVHGAEEKTWDSLPRTYSLWDTYGWEPDSPSDFVRGKTTGGRVISMAVRMGYKKIICAGIDLYDRRYFYLPHDAWRTMSTNGAPNKWREYPLERKGKQKGFHARKTFLGWLEKYHGQFKQEGVSLYSYNPKSLLLRVPFVKRFPCE